MKEKQLIAEENRRARNRNAYSLSAQPNVRADDTRRQFRSPSRHPIVSVHGQRSGLWVVIPRPSETSVVIDIPTSPLRGQNNAFHTQNSIINNHIEDLPPSYEECPTYEESIRKMKEQGQL